MILRSRVPKTTRRVARVMSGMSDVKHCFWRAVGRWWSRGTWLGGKCESRAAWKFRDCLVSTQYKILVVSEVMKSGTHQNADRRRRVVR
jgi:hypothetical protein